MSVVSRMALQHRYMPTLARMVVMSQVPRAATTLGRAAITSSRVMITSVWSAPMNWRRLPSVLQIDGVGVHADSEGADRLSKQPGGDGTHQAGVQSAREKKAQGGIGVQPLVHRGDKLVMDVLADGVHGRRTG